MANTVLEPTPGIEIRLTTPDGLAASLVAKLAGEVIAEFFRTGCVIRQAVVKAIKETDVIIDFYDEHSRYLKDTNRVLALAGAVQKAKEVINRMDLDAQDRDDFLEDINKIKMKHRQRFGQ